MPTRIEIHPSSTSSRSRDPPKAMNRCRRSITAFVLFGRAALYKDESSNKGKHGPSRLVGSAVGAKVEMSYWQHNTSAPTQRSSETSALLRKG